MFSYAYLQFEGWNTDPFRPALFSKRISSVEITFYEFIPFLLLIANLLWTLFIMQNDKLMCNNEKLNCLNPQ